MKLRDVNDLFTELDIQLEYGAGVLFGKNVRYLEPSGVFQVGSSEFDRWANSEDFEFDLWLKKGQRAFLRWHQEEKYKQDQEEITS